MNVKDNRSFWVYLLLSIVTCGLYSIYFWYVYVEDLNTIFYGDGKDKDHNFSYITGNIAPGLNLQVQTSGPGHEKAARDFVKSLRARQLAKK